MLLLRVVLLVLLLLLLTVLLVLFVAVHRLHGLLHGGLHGLLHGLWIAPLVRTRHRRRRASSALRGVDGEVGTERESVGRSKY